MKTSDRKRLDRESIIETCLQLAAVPGTSTISVRDLGASLGADPTSIYRHFRSKEELMEALLDELTRRSVAAVIAPPEDWRGRLRQLTAATLELFVKYPAIGVEGIVLTTHGRGELDAIELMLDAFARAGLSGQDLVTHYALLASHVLSSAAGIARGRSTNWVPEERSHAWFDGTLLADPRIHPRISEFGPQLSQLEDDELFHLGVEFVIQSAERVAANIRTEQESLGQ